MCYVFQKIRVQGSNKKHGKKTRFPSKHIEEARIFISDIENTQPHHPSWLMSQPHLVPLFSPVFSFLPFTFHKIYDDDAKNA